MEIRSIQSFNAIPATLIRGVFNWYVSNLLCKLYCKYFIHASIHLFFPFLLTIVNFFKFVTNLYLLTYLQNPWSWSKYCRKGIFKTFCSQLSFGL